MNRLLKLGFINVGHWTLVNNLLNYHLISHHRVRNVLYSFISNGEIKYIGKTTMELSKRMYGYKNPGPTQRTNIRVNARIRELLLSDQPLDIFVLFDNGLLKYGDYKINLAAGLEDTMIYEICPEWNFSGKKRLEPDKKSEKIIIPTNKMEIQNRLTETFEVKLGTAYYNQGFFNVPIKYSENFDADMALIEIQLGEKSDYLIQGYINRTANNNGTPRIMGGKMLSNWIKENFREGDSLKVKILTKRSIIII